MQSNFSDYIIYADESGDHSLTKIDKGFPIFCLALCVIKKEDYINNIVPAIQALKFKYWGHDNLILHEREIRKQEKEFTVFKNDLELRNSFFNDIGDIIKQAPFYTIASIIDKNKGAVLVNQPICFLTHCFNCFNCALESLLLKRHSHSFKYSLKCSLGTPLNFRICRFAWFQKFSIPLI